MPAGPVHLNGPMPVLPLRTSRLTLRLMRPSDATTLVRYRNDPAVARYQDWELPYTDASAAAMVAAQDDVDDITPGRWVQIALVHTVDTPDPAAADGILVGDAAVGLDATGSLATLGYTLDPVFQGRGYAGEAAAALVDALFAGTTVHRILATLDPANHASLRVIEPLGFRREGLARQAEFIRGEWLDDLRFGLLRDDRAAWLARPRTAPATVTLEPVTPDSLGAVRRLETFWYQRAFVSPMDSSLAQALVPGEHGGHPVTPWLRAVVADGEVVGFAMVAAAGPGTPEPYLWRFLLDRHHQRRGIGRRAIGALVDTFRAGGHAAMRVSWAEGPGGPRPFYEGLGFVPTGEFDGDEVVARLEFCSFRG